MEISFYLFILFLQKKKKKKFLPDTLKRNTTRSTGINSRSGGADHRNEVGVAWKPERTDDQCLLIKV